MRTASNAQYGCPMSWWEYVKRTAKTDADSPKAMSLRTGIDAPHFSKWKRGDAPGPRLAAEFARGYDRPVLEAFVAAKFLTADEAKVRPAAAPDYTRLTNDELLELVRSRMRKEGGEAHGNAAPTKGPGSGPGVSLVEPVAADEDYGEDPLDEAEETERST